MKYALFLALFPFLSSAQISVGGNIFISPDPIKCNCTLNDVIVNGNSAFHAFTLSDGITETAYRATEGIYGIRLSMGMPDFSFGNIGVIPTMMLRDASSYYTFKLVADNLTTNRLHKAPDNDGTYIAAIHGNGSPEGVITANIGTFYVNDGGGANVTLWIKESGTGNTGWINK